jgi:hypothetical protein
MTRVETPGYLMPSLRDFGFTDSEKSALKRNPTNWKTA